MEEEYNPSAAVCRLCGALYKLPENDVNDNLPRVLLCGHIFCTICLLSTECDNAVSCPECEVESTLPEGGVYGLQEESRIIGLLYTTKMNKMKSLQNEKSEHHNRNKLPTSTGGNDSTKDKDPPPDSPKIEKKVDEALALAAENLSQLEHIEETLTIGLAEQVKRERARLEIEIEKASEKAMHAVQKWKDMQWVHLTKLDFTTTQAAVCQVQERKKALEIAMQMAREVQSFPFLQKYCALDKVLETLQAPLMNQSFDMKCINMGSGIRVVFHSDHLSDTLAISLKMEVGSPEHSSESQPLNCQPDTCKEKSPWKSARNHVSGCITPSENKLHTPQKQDSQTSVVPSLCPEPQPHRKFSLSSHSSTLDSGNPDVIIEEIIEERAVPPTGPELANDKWRTMSKRRNYSFPSRKRDVAQWVVVTHVVNPSHFYIRYVAEKKQCEILSKKINCFCSGDSCNFTSKDTVETGSLVFAKYKDDQWGRAHVVEILKTGSVDPVNNCFVTQLAAIRIFFNDFGLTKSISIVSQEGNTESSLKAVNSHMRKVGEAVNVEQGYFSPQAVRCSLKDLVPYDLKKGWSKEAEVEFGRVVGCTVVEMLPLGQDRDRLLVDLRKAPMDQSCDIPISVRQYLVFVEMARFYSPVKLDTRTLLYYPPVYPKINTELSALVSHINSPADFYIQLIDNMESILLFEKLQDFYSATPVLSGEELSIYCPVIGQACVARFDDKMWYRAQVTGHPGGRKVEVCYVDFGNKKVLSVGDLRKIKDEFFALPAMAIHCFLSDVLPTDGDTFSDACKERFLSLAHQKKVTVVATAKVSKTLSVKLFEGSPNQPLTSISEMLVKEELACFIEGIKSNKAMSSCEHSVTWDPPLKVNSVIDATKAPDQKNSEKQCEDTSEIHPQLKFPTQLVDLKVRVTHVNSPSSFYVQFIQNDSQLKRICEQVKMECALMEPADVAWKAELYCSALINGVWNRGQICSDVTSDDIAEVRRCDHGNVVKVNISDLRPLPPYLIGSVALECSLNDIRPAGGRTTWTNTARDLLSYHLTGASAILTIKELTDERPVPVTLLCSNKKGQFVSVSDFLASEGLALKERKLRDAVIPQPRIEDAFSPVSKTETNEENKKSPPSVFVGPLPPAASNSSTPIPPKPAPRTVISAEKVKTSLYKPPELPCLGLIRITVSAVGDDGLVYARTQNAEHQLEQLREKVQQRMKALPRQKPYTWKSVQGCVVFGPDMMWYRGELLEVQGGSVKVQNVDSGLVENIPVVHVHPMVLCNDVPQLCFPCQLFGVKPVGVKWHQDAVTLLREILVKRSVDMQVMELPSDPREPLTAQIYLDGLSLSSILCQYQHASLDQTVSPLKKLSVMFAASVLDDWDINTEGLLEPEEPILGPFATPTLPEKGEHFKVKVKHLCTPNELFLSLLEGSEDLKVGGETLDEALTRTNKDLDLLPHITDFPSGGPVLAEYSDGRYYRAKLMKIISTEPVTVLVQHVDFGSDDTLSLSKLRQMPADLLQFPPQALKVKIAGLKAPRRMRETDLLPYSPEWSVKAVMVMIDLLHTNITATVVARKPELSVLLFNEDRELVHMPLVDQGLAGLE